MDNNSNKTVAEKNKRSNTGICRDIYKWNIETVITSKTIIKIMKYLITLLTLITLISCNNSQTPKYNRKAIDINNKATELSIRGEWSKALTMLDKAIELDSSYHTPHINKVDIYLNMGKYDKALHESEMIITKKPDLAESWFFTGLLNECQGNKTRAITCYKESILLFTKRINNPDKQEDINANKLNRALSKMLIGDKSYINDFNELSKIDNYSFMIEHLKAKTRKEIINELIRR